MAEEINNILAVVDTFLRRVFVDMGDKIKDVDLPVTPQDIKILMVIYKHEAVSISYLASRIHRDKSQVTRKVKEFESSGILSHKSSEKDQRVTILELTPLGLQTAKKVERILHGVLENILKPLSQSEKTNLAALLQKIS